MSKINDSKVGLKDVEIKTWIRSFGSLLFIELNDCDKKVNNFYLIFNKKLIVYFS